MNAKSRVVLVTGASSGFGRAIATALAADGHRVFGTARQRRTNAPIDTTLLPLDVTDDASVAACVDDVLRQTGRIDVLINNAGFAIAGALEDTGIDEARAQFETNVLGAHRLCRAVLPTMRAQRSGHIINIGSLAGQIAVPFHGFYCASKFALDAYTQTLRMELRAHGIRVALVEPGDFATGFTANRRLTPAHTSASPYFQDCQRAIARMIADEQANTDLSPVVNAVRRIIASGNPRLRYREAPSRQRLFAALKPFLPQKLAEYLVRISYGLD